MQNYENQNEINVDIEINEELASEFINFSFEKEAKGILNYALSYLDFPYYAQIDILITTPKEVHKINLENRNIDKSTDVLSFPMNEVIDYKDEKTNWQVNYDTENVILGDIVINAGAVIGQAESYGHSIRREYCFLLLHSLLHLLGYDHEVESEEKEMFSLQKEILDTYGIKR